ncbi:MAG: flagellar motor protein MotB [Desulfurobacteriaceae bacterium]
MIVSPRSRWKLSVIDVLFILIIFFVIVLSHSTLDISKVILFKSRMGEISGNKGLLNSPKNSIGPPMVRPLYPPRKKVLRKIKGKMEKLKEKYPFIREFKVIETKKTIKVLFPCKITFESGSYRLKPETIHFLQEICEALKDPSIKKIVIKGHTDNVPGVDNWVLSAKRAESVLKVLIKECKIPKVKFKIMACADTEPVAPNTSPEGKAKNRRVEIELHF